MSNSRRHVTQRAHKRLLRTLATYIVVMWGLAQGLAALAPSFEIPLWVTRGFVYSAAAAIPLVAWLAWRYQIAPQQFTRNPGGPDEQSASVALLNDIRARHENLGTGHIRASWIDATGHRREHRSLGPVVIGRDDACDIVIEDCHVSRNHAILWASSTDWHVSDLHSANGTWIDNKRIDDTRLMSTDIIHLDQQGPAIQVHFEPSDRTVISDQ